jgi:hypothetical protein
MVSNGLEKKFYDIGPRLLAPEDDAHVEGADADEQDWKDVRHEQDQDVVAGKRDIFIKR